MPAALLMSNVQAVLKSFASKEITPSEVCAQVNKVLCHNMVPQIHLLLLFAFRHADQKARLRQRRPLPTNAGAWRNLCADERRRPSLGVFPDQHYFGGEIQLSSGDTLVFFTDGVTEARNASGEEFGEERLQELLTSVRTLVRES